MTASRMRICLFVIAVACILTRSASAGERLIIQLKDFSKTELKSGGFTLSGETKLHLSALGAGGDAKVMFSKSDMFAYGWIIDANTRALVWQMSRANTSKDGKERKFDGEITLPKGSYEAYFCAYGYVGGSAFSAFNINVDPRHNDEDGKKK